VAMNLGLQNGQGEPLDMGFTGQSTFDSRESINVTFSMWFQIFLTLFFAPLGADLVLNCGTADEKRKMSWLGSCIICS